MVERDFTRGGFTEFERYLIRARTGEGHERAKARGVHMGRAPLPTPPSTRRSARGTSIGAATQTDLARRFNVSRSTISRLDFATGAEMAIDLQGNWRVGKAFDVHVLSSIYLGPNEFGHAKFDTTRSEMGELVHKLKYRNDKSVLPQMIALLDRIPGIEEFGYIIPIPPTNKGRQFQPVTEIALALGQRRNVRVLTNCLAKASGGRQLKNVNDVAERERLVKEGLCIEGNTSISGCHVLVVDDLYDTGSTLRAATDLLMQQAKAASVCVLTMTKSKR